MKQPEEVTDRRSPLTTPLTKPGRERTHDAGQVTGFFYNLGRQLGRKAVPAVRRSKWIYDGLTGTEEEARRAELALGSELVAELNRTLQPSSEVSLQRMTDEVVHRLGACLRDRSRTFPVQVFHDPIPNVVALPGGFLFVSDSLLDFCDRQPEELAFVFGHEMAHVIRKHAFDRLINETALRVASTVTSRLGQLGSWLHQEGLALLRSAHERDREFEADDFGLQLASAAGYSSDAAVAFLQRIGRQQPHRKLGHYLESHPGPSERLAKLRTSHSFPRGPVDPLQPGG